MTVENSAYGTGDTSYRAAGEFAGLLQLSTTFYQVMDSLPEASVIRAMHPDNLELSSDKLACFLSGWLAGGATVVS